MISRVIPREILKKSRKLLSISTLYELLVPGPTQEAGFRKLRQWERDSTITQKSQMKVTAKRPREFALKHLRRTQLKNFGKTFSKNSRRTSPMTTTKTLPRTPKKNKTMGTQTVLTLHAIYVSGEDTKANNNHKLKSITPLYLVLTESGCRVLSSESGFNICSRLTGP